MHRSVLALCLCVALSSACGDNSPSAPTTTQPTDLSGSWSGDLALAGASARMTWTLTQKNADVTGPVLVVLPTGVVLLNGVLTGTLAGSTLTYTISIGAGGIPTQPLCVGQLGGTMTVTIGLTSTLTGNYALRSSTCTTLFNGGSLTLTKQ
ncbi:MAG TPA: hypothetical protein VG222_08505 [Vicinamibacterales bacterium]|nr:hypothetical protein [Vicinamibacterales bacterium]